MDDRYGISFVPYMFQALLVVVEHGIRMEVNANVKN